MAAHARRWYYRTEPRHQSCRITRWADITRLRQLLTSIPPAGTDASKRQSRVTAHLEELEEAFRKDSKIPITPWARPRNIDVRGRVA